jgi:starvation-inducible DNA-binding protein
MALRELFGKVAQGVEEDANLMAARIVQFGGMAEGTAQAVARRTALDAYRLATADGNGHIDALATTLTDFGRHVRYASAQASELKDADTAALFTQIARGIDTWLWFVQTSRQAGS